MAGMLGALVLFTVASEFIRGGRVIAGKTGQGLVASMVHLAHRNTRRYGGYIVHVGIALLFIGVLGTPLNQTAEKEMGFGDNWKQAQEKVKQAYVPEGRQPEAMMDLYNQSVGLLKKNDLLTIPPLAEETWRMLANPSQALCTS